MFPSQFLETKTPKDMNNKFLLQVILCLFIGYHSQAQCPIAPEGIISNSVNNGGTCTFDLEIFYENGNANNSSIIFLVYSDGIKIYESNCFERLKTSEGPFVTTITGLQASCGSEITAFYQGFTSPICGGNDCQPVPGGAEITLLGSLPVDIVSFQGHTDNYDQVKLEWVTTSEESNKSFIVERSSDGRAFEAIGTLEGNGNSSIENYYSFMDKFPVRGENYYRLKQVDFDQSFEYSTMITVKMEMDFSTPLTIAPSAAENELTLIFNELPKENARIEVFNASGIIMLNTRLAEGNHILELDLSNYLPGMYFIRVPIGKEFVIKKFVKIRS